MRFADLVLCATGCVSSPDCDARAHTGKIVYLHVFGQGLVFLNTSEVAVDLMEKRGAIYSDKPSLVMAGEL